MDLKNIKVQIDSIDLFNDQQMNSDYQKLLAYLQKEIKELYRGYVSLSRIAKFCFDVDNYSILEYKTGGYVYFIKNKYTGMIKIGCTKNVKNRLSEINSVMKNYMGVEDAIQIVGMIDTSFIKPKELEKYFHEKYKQYRRFGEWFDFPDEIIIQIKKDFFFEFKYNDMVSEKDECSFGSDCVHNINYIGNPSDDDFFEFLYKRYDRSYILTNEELESIAFMIISEAFKLPTPIPKLNYQTNNTSFYNYVKNTLINRNQGLSSI